MGALHAESGSTELCSLIDLSQGSQANLLSLVSDLAVLMRLSICCKDLNGTVLCAPGLLHCWSSRMSRQPLDALPVEGPKALNVIRWANELDFSGEWTQQTLPSAETPTGCEFRFTLQRGNMPQGPLFHELLSVELSDPQEDGPLGQPLGYCGSGTFQMQHAWQDPIHFDVVGWSRGAQLCYRIIWECHGSSTMHCEAPLLWQREEPCEGVFVNYEGDDVTEKSIRGEGNFLLQHVPDKANNPSELGHGYIGAIGGLGLT